MYFLVLVFIALVLFMIVYGRYVRVTGMLQAKCMAVDSFEETTNRKIDALNRDIDVVRKEIQEKEAQLRDLEEILAGGTVSLSDDEHGESDS